MTRTIRWSGYRRAFALTVLLVTGCQRSEPSRDLLLDVPGDSATAVATAKVPLVGHYAPVVVPTSFTPITRGALETLGRWSRFSRGGEGVAGTTSEGKRAAITIGAQPDAVAAFRWLMRHGSEPGRLYAYWGLLELDPDAAAEYRDDLLADDTRIQVMHGCNIGDDEVGRIAADLHEPGPRLTPRPAGQAPVLAPP